MYILIHERILFDHDATVASFGGGRQFLLSIPINTIEEAEKFQKYWANIGYTQGKIIELYMSLKVFEAKYHGKDTYVSEDHINNFLAENAECDKPRNQIMIDTLSKLNTNDHSLFSTGSKTGLISQIINSYYSPTNPDEVKIELYSDKHQKTKSSYSKENDSNDSILRLLQSINNVAGSASALSQSLGLFSSSSQGTALGASASAKTARSVMSKVILDENDEKPELVRFTYADSSDDEEEVQIPTFHYSR